MKIVRENLYRDKLKLTAIFDLPEHHVFPVLQKIHVIKENLSQKKKNNNKSMLR